MPANKRLLLPAEGEEIPVSIQNITAWEEMLWTALEPVQEQAFPPCIKGIISGGGGGSGRHRTAAILAAFLGQTGYRREEAKKIWSGATAVQERIFDEWFLKMHCPRCRIMKRQSKGYPDLGVADIGLCRPDENCPKFESPVEYACGMRTKDGGEEEEKGRLLHIKTQYRVRIFDWSTGREGEIELNQKEKETLEALLAEKTGQKDKVIIYKRARVRGKLKPRFFLRDWQGPRRQMLSDIL
ncbi:MAG: hypothetical protein A4E49_02259 [Methanosaeta sp. PtaU1.Bin112]|nr:MAG: hypothetical protein A4E49_02259 [Methanosaeta sp. PtaU1.Bin112]